MDLAVGGHGTAVAFGAPGVYLLPQEAAPVLGSEPLDVAAFVGVAPRGPAWESVTDPTLADRGITRARSVAVPVDSWRAYVEQFGAFEGPGLLPHAVAAFFAQGGRRAFVLRIVHDEAARDRDGRQQPLGCAEYELAPGPGGPPVIEAADGGRVRLRARNEGTWGSGLQITLSFTARPLPLVDSEPAAVVLAGGARLPAGSVLRLRGVDGLSVLRRVIRSEPRGRSGRAVIDLLAALDAPPGFVVRRAEEVLAELSVVDGDTLVQRTETFTGLGLDAGHPRWLAAEVQAHSRLIEVAGSAAGPDDAPVLSPLRGLRLRDAALPAVPAVLRKNGTDRWSLVTPADIFGRLLQGDEAGTQGLDALLRAPEVASVVVPDLYSPVPLPPAEPVDISGVFSGPEFAPCMQQPPRRHAAPADDGLAGLRLDPGSPVDLPLIVQRQQMLVTTAEYLRIVALLDVPPGLRHHDVLRWRAAFDSSWAAAYHPWLRSTFGGAGIPLTDLPPAAVAAGIIARCERRSGVPRGPANEPAAGIVDVAERIEDARLDELHAEAINVFGHKPDAVRLIGARTLATERGLRLLTVRRLLQLIERAVGRQLLWTVFEPNDGALRAGLHRMVDHLLGDLFARGAFAGATPAESWFVHTATGPALAAEADAGRLLVEIGLALSAPLEYILLRVTLDAGGNLQIRAGTGPEVTVHG